MSAKRAEPGRMRVRRSALALLAMTALALLAAMPAAAGPPTHLRDDARDLAGFDHACGVAVDSEGDIYVASAGESKIKVFDPTHAEPPLTSIENENEPCALAVNSTGELFVVERTSGNVVRYKPNAYPFAGTPTYGAAEPIYSGGDAEGVSVDPFDGRIYIARGEGIAVHQANGSPEPPANEVQRIRIIESTGGTYTLTFKGQMTPALPFNASCEQIDAALEGLSTIGAGNVVLAPEASGDVVRCIVTFAAALFQKTLPQIGGDGSKLTGGTFGLFITNISQGFSGQIGEDDLTDASGVAAYTHKVTATTGDRYVFAAEADSDEVMIFSGADVKEIELRRTVGGVDHDRRPETAEQAFGFGTAGANLAVDRGNRSEDDKCNSIAEQACTAGHLLLYDAANNVVNEFEASGEFLDQFTHADLTDAEPTAMAVERSGGPNDGTIYVSAGAGAGARVLAFGPLAAPSRPPLTELSEALNKDEQLKTARTVATDRFGDVYVGTSAEVQIFDPSGTRLAKFSAPIGPNDLAVDSQCNVYVLERQVGNERVTYYSPSACPPVTGTTYARHEPPVASSADFPSGNKTLLAIAVNPGPGAGKDHLLVTTSTITREYDSAAADSGLLRCYACGLNILPRQTIAVHGASGKVYLGANNSPIAVVNAAGDKVVARINGGGCPGGSFKANPFLAVDQANGHVVEFQPGEAAREYDASGACVAEFGQFDNVPLLYRVAINNSCALHEPPLTEATTPSCAEFDPSYGNVYVAYDNSAPGSFDVTAFGPLTYGEAPAAVTGIATDVGVGAATLNGTVNPHDELTECKFEYLSDAQYTTNGETFAGASSAPCAETLEEIGKGAEPVAVHAELSGLDPDERYRFRLIATNKYGESVGEDWLFGPPLATTLAAGPVLYDEATLRAEVDPSGLATEYYFEYGEGEGEYEHSTPVEVLAPGDGPLAVQAELTGLAEGTAYHFRIVAENEAKATAGADRSFEMLERRTDACPNSQFRSGLSAGLPDCRAYELITPGETKGLSPQAVRPLDPGIDFNSWLVAPRGVGAGESVAYFTPGTLPGFEGNGTLDGYRATRSPGEHPAAGWSSELFGPTYRESVASFGFVAAPLGLAPDQRYSFWETHPEESFEGTLPEGVYLRTPSGFEVLGKGSLGEDLEATSHFLTAGGTHAIFSSEQHLEADPDSEEDAAPAGTLAIYDRAAGATSAEVVSLKPDGSAFGAGEDATYVGASEDGSTILFKVGGALYARSEGKTTLVVSSANTFAGVSTDGERVFYADGGSGAAAATLHAFDLDTQSETQIAEDSIFVNVSPEGSGVLFTSEEALTGSEENEAGQSAEDGERNLYAWDGATQAAGFVGILAAADFDSFGAIPQMDLEHWTAAVSMGVGTGRAFSPTRATPGGEVFLFQSHAQLTAYDNEGHGEIYRYQPGAEAGKRLICVSCDPTGAPPSADAMLQISSLGAAATQKTLIPNVTDDGEAVFFQSFDRLMPEDANEVLDVYQWKAQGEGCKRARGCLSLISTGQGEQASHLYGMSADGRDVFFRTREKLVGADVPGSPSLYDARVLGGIPDPPAPEPCQGDACQGQGSTPPALAPPTSTAAGEDANVKPRPKPKRCPKGKRKVKRGGKVKCVPRGGKKRGAKRARGRANHDRRAQR